VAATYAEGVAEGFKLLRDSVTAPSRSIDAALMGLFRLEPEKARRAKRRAMRLAMLTSVPGVILVMALVVATALFAR